MTGTDAIHTQLRAEVARLQADLAAARAEVERAEASLRWANQDKVNLMADLAEAQTRIVELIEGHDLERLSKERDEARADVERLRGWVGDAARALDAATTIGQRSCRDGDHLNYGNHDRLIREAAALAAHPDTTFCWLIERGQPEGQTPTVWLDCSAEPTYGAWVTDANEASKFPTREAAEAYIEERAIPNARAVEHGWLPHPDNAEEEGV